MISVLIDQPVEFHTMVKAVTGEIVEAVLMPHPPVIIPEVGGERQEMAAATADACRQLGRELALRQVDAVIVLSPHAPRSGEALGIYDGEVIGGDMGRFGCPDTTLQLPSQPELVERLEEAIRDSDLRSWRIPAAPIDHGAFVPLYFLDRAGMRVPTVVMGLGPQEFEELARAGAAIAAAVRVSGLRVALIASGDMSHSLQPGAPCGFDPRAEEFDRAFVERLRSGQVEALEAIDPEVRRRAHEDVLESTLIAMHAIRNTVDPPEVLSYEAPFGVGYCVARLLSNKDQANEGALLPKIARDAVASAFGNGSSEPEWVATGFLDQPAGVFVTIRRSSGQLRGCRGTIEPQCDNLVEETVAVAKSSAFGDGRFQPIEESELPQLQFEVSVLHRPEPIDSPEELDPQRYGVIIRTRDGRRGLMLPGVEGLDTVEQQINATCRKAHIDPNEPVSLERFRVDKFAEN